MTLVPYPPEALDELALRMLDMTAQVREMSHVVRDYEIEGFRLHGNKVNEWLVHLERWVVDSNARLEAEVKRRQGARRASRLLAMTTEPAPTRKKKSR